ncbi:MAG: hypothetical protein WCK02_16175 [Bacteroidota bacterium]
MQKINIKTPKPELSEQQILSTKQPFNNLLSSFNAMSKFSLLSKGWLYGLSGAVITSIVVVLAVYNSKNTKPDPNTVQTSEKADSVKMHDFVYEPFEEIGIDYQVAEITSNEAQKIETNTGTKINIPANSFVDKNNNPVSAPLKLLYREFHNPVDIFLSGIPMNYDSAGTRYCFESAGMIDVRAMKGNDTLYLAKNKSINVDLISNNKDQKFNLYYLDTVKNNWSYMGKDKISPMAISKAIKKTKANSDSLILTAQAEYVKPVITTKNKIVFKVDFESKDFPELSIYKNILFEVNENKTKFNKAWYQINWAKISLKRINANNEYQVTLSKRDSTVNLITKAAFAEKEYQSAITAYNEANKKKAQATSKVASVSATYLSDEFANSNLINNNTFYRNFSMNALGTWNCDVPMPIQQFAIVNNPSFKDIKTGAELKLKRVYIATLDANSVIEYSPLRIGYSTKLKNICFGITYDEKIYIISPETFKSTIGIAKSTFKGDVLEPIEGVRALKKLIQI